MTRPRLLVIALVAALAAAAPAGAAIFIRLTTTSVHRAGVLRLVGNARRMPLYALSAARLPCSRYGTCREPVHRAAPPKRPFVFLGDVPAMPNGSTRAFAIRLPRTLRAGRYKIFVWCKACGGSLVIAGSTSSGQTLRVIP